MLWVNLIMDSFASLALATEMPTPELLNRKPYGRNSPLVSPIMFCNIASQVIYQLAVILCLLFFGATLFDIEKGGDSIVALPTQHFTIIFNVFVIMTMFNEINARKIHGEVNVFQGIFTNPIFYVIWIGTSIAQIIIVTFGGFVFQTKALSVAQWMWCLFFGVGTMIWAQFTRLVYMYGKKNFKCKFQIKRKKSVEQEEAEMDEITDEQSEGRILWLRSFKRVQTQLNTIRAFNDVLKEVKEKKARGSI
jgi:Ca2+ transporting ATPase